uniref:Uncharacterized protein n=1 Tax=mine drainage metagenome TaxID=410659 RepID=E6QUN9_9ZZZZ
MLAKTIRLIHPRLLKLRSDLRPYWGTHAGRFCRMRTCQWSLVYPKDHWMNRANLDVAVKGDTISRRNYSQFSYVFADIPHRR